MTPAAERNMTVAFAMVRQAQGQKQTIADYKDQPQYIETVCQPTFRQKKAQTLYSCWIGEGEFAVCVTSMAPTKGAAVKAYKAWRAGQ